MDPWSCHHCFPAEGNIKTPRAEFSSMVTGEKLSKFILRDSPGYTLPEESVFALTRSHVTAQCFLTHVVWRQMEQAKGGAQ